MLGICCRYPEGGGGKIFLYFEIRCREICKTGDAGKRNASRCKKESERKVFGRKKKEKKKKKKILIFRNQICKRRIRTGC